MYAYSSFFDPHITAQLEPEPIDLSGLGSLMLLAGAMIVFLLVVGSGLWLFMLPYRKGTAGILNEFEVGVVLRYGNYVDSKTISPIDLDGNRIDYRSNWPNILRNLFWRHPIGTKVIRVNTQYNDIKTSKANAIVDGTEVEFDVRGFYRLTGVSYFLRRFNVFGKSEDAELTAQGKLEKAVHDAALKVLSTTVIEALAHMPDMTITKLKRQDKDILDFITEQVDLAGWEIGIRFDRIGFENVGVPDILARALAAPALARINSQAARNRASLMLGEEGEISQIKEYVRQTFPDASEAETTALTMRFMQMIVADNGGGMDFVMSND